MITVTGVTGKLGRVRVLPLHPSTSQALADYLQLRTTVLPTPKTTALFVSNASTRLIYNAVQNTFARLAAQAGVFAISRRCRPRIHDLRHYVDGRVMRPAGPRCLVTKGFDVSLSA